MHIFFSNQNWWSAETRKRFDNKLQCFVDQYSNFSFPSLLLEEAYKGPINVDGVKTLGENVAGRNSQACALCFFKK